MSRDSASRATPEGKYRPILFSGPMVRAILEGRKTQTRRVVKWKPHEPGYNLTFSGMSVGHHCTGVPSSGWVLYSRGAGGCWNERTKPLHSPYGQPGDRLWVRETWGIDQCGSRVSLAPEAWPGGWPASRLRYNADGGIAFGKRPAIHMPRWACRVELDVMDVEIERLQDITPDDCIAEGIEPHDSGDAAEEDAFNRAAYAELWDSINGRGAWDKNPWVWVVTFERAT